MKPNEKQLVIIAGALFALVLVVRVCAQRLVWPSRVSRPRVSRRFSRHVRTLLPPKVVLLRPLATWGQIAGSGICLTL